MIEFKRKDGKPLYAEARAVTAWTASSENPKLTDIWIGGKMFTLGESAEDVKHKLEHSWEKPIG